MRICWTVTQVQGVCLTGLVGDLWNWNAGLSEFEVGFLGACGSYGGSAENVWGKCVRRVVVWGNRDTVWGGGPCVGEAAESHGERKSHEKPEIWKREAAARHGGRRTACGSLSQWQTWRDLRTLHIFATTGSAARAWAPPDWTALLLVHCSIFGGFHSFSFLKKPKSLAD